MNNNSKLTCLYIFMLSTEGDYGPKEHVRQIFKNMRAFNIIGFSNIPSETIGQEYKIISKDLELWRPSFIKIVLFQIYAAKVIFKLKREKKKNIVVLIRQSIGFVIPALACRILNIPSVVEVNGVFHQDLLDRKRGKWLQLVNKMAESITYKLCHRIIIVHENIKTALTALYEVSDKKFVTIENGTEARDWVHPDDARNKAKLIDDDYRIGYLGSLSYRQGVDIILRVAHIMREDNFKFILVGGTAAEVQEIKKNIEQNGLSQNIEITGYMPKNEALKIMETCDAFIHLRRRINLSDTDIEGSPLKMLDYHSVGRPVIASRTSSYQYIEDKSYGVLVDADNEKDVVKGIKTLMKEKEKWLESGKWSNEYVRENKSWEVTVQKVEQELLHVYSE